MNASATLPDTIRLRHGGPLQGQLRPPGDKSVSHRALLLGAMATGLRRSGDSRAPRTCSTPAAASSHWAPR